MMNEFEKALNACAADPVALLCDLRDEEDYAAGHIPGAVHLRHDRLTQDIGELADLDTPLYLYCYSGHRCAQAEVILQAMGYSAVRVLGGLDSYDGDLVEEG